ncbi:hypothetical protein WMY93_011819 [Mugilogobius chulae]|uniref:Uncharacterized protein n=1 Tax=Mugilogobius chulae TaxID=88201 RepID=A0AAW0PFV2_9GOBI
MFVCVSCLAVLCNISGVLVSNWTLGNASCPPSDQIQVQTQTPSEQYWDESALRRSSGMNETGTVVWHLALCLLLSSIIVGAALIKGIKSSGKVVYFTATFPYVVILILLIRGATLEGAREGIEYYIGTQSNLTKLTDAQVWKDAATQTFYSLSIGWGGVLTLASYNNFNNNVSKMLLSSASLMQVLGWRSLCICLSRFCLLHCVFVVPGFGGSCGPGALLRPASSSFPSLLCGRVVLFMLLTVGLDSQFAGIEVVITCLVDAFPSLLNSKRAFLTLGISCSVFLLGLPCVTQAGIYWVTLIDGFLGTWVLLVVGFMEVVGVSYIYGGNRFIKDIEMMIGEKSFFFWFWWRACWFFISPCIILVILVWSLVTLTPPSYGTVPYPDWALALGWCIAAFVLMWIPLVALYKFIKAKGSVWERLKSLCHPTEDWHPFLEKHRGERYSAEKKTDKQNVDTWSISAISSSWL